MGSSSNADTSTFYIYILELNNGNYYTGYTIDIARRWQEHVTGKKGAKYTRANKPVGIAQCWQFEGTIGQALKIESLIKRRARAFKDKIIDSPDKLQVAVQKSIDANIEIRNVNTRAIISDEE